MLHLDEFARSELDWRMAKYSKNPIQSVRSIVQAFGGTKATADWAGIGMSAVSDWIADDRIPPGWHYRIDRELRRRGYEIDPAVFGIVEHAEAP